MSPSTFPALLQRFFTERLMTQQGASPHTVAGYRDTFRLLLRFAAARLHCAPSALRIEQLDVPFLEMFLEHLERDRGNRPRSRNQRLAALHGFFRYVALAEPACSLQCQRILAIPPKRFERGPVAFLTQDEAKALIAAPNVDTWIGRRDRAILALALQTGLRNSEIRRLRRQDVELGVGPLPSKPANTARHPSRPRRTRLSAPTFIIAIAPVVVELQGQFSASRARGEERRVVTAYAGAAGDAPDETHAEAGRCLAGGSTRRSFNAPPQCEQARGWGAGASISVLSGLAANPCAISTRALTSSKGTPKEGERKP